jgi:type I restriction enzyme S subunit
MREGWEEKRLDQICDMYQPKTISKKEMTLNGKFPVFGANGIIGRYNEFNHEEPELLITCRGATCGSVNISVSKSWINGNAMVVRPKEENLNKEFLTYIFLGGIDISNIITGSAQPQITRQSLNPIIIPIPQISEQIQIVAILDKAFTAIEQAKAKIEKNIVNAKELFQSKLNAIFSQKGDGWEEKTLKEISIDFGRGKSKNRPRNDKKLFGGEYPFVQTGDIRNTGKILKTFSQTYNEVGLAQSKLWTKGTICITIAANIAETAILDFDSCFPDSMIGLIVDPKKADSNYTYYALQFLKSRLQELGKGSAQDNINLGTFQKQYFPFPSIKKQKEIVIILDNISKQTTQIESNYNKKLEDLEELKKSILQKAFSGELTQKEVEV